MEFATWPDDFFTTPVCKFGLISIIVHKAHQRLKQGHKKLCRTIQQKVTQHCGAVRNKSTLYVDSLIYAICNLALVTERRTTELPSCSN